MNLKEQTVETYNRSAEAFSKKFDNQGARIEDIRYVFGMCEKSNPFVLEIGCGNGRDAKEILKCTSRYIGIDISEGLLSIAQKALPTADLRIADIEHFEFPKGLDVVFAFASLIHIQKTSLMSIMSNIYEHMNKDGLVFISLKFSPTYNEVTKEDEFGTRTYWHYSQDDVLNIASGFTCINTSIKDIRGQLWIDILFQKL